MAETKAAVVGEMSSNGVEIPKNLRQDLMEMSDGFAKTGGEISSVEVTLLFEKANDGDGMTDSDRATLDYVLATKKFSEKAKTQMQHMLKEQLSKASEKTPQEEKAKPKEETPKEGKPSKAKEEAPKEEKQPKAKEDTPKEAPAQKKAFVLQKDLIAQAKAFVKSGGVISDAEAHSLWESALDGPGVTQNEFATLEHIMNTFKFTDKARKYLGNLVTQTKSGKSMYKVINKIRYDRSCLDLAEHLTKDGKLDVADAKLVWENVQDGPGVTECEKRSVEWVMDKYTMTDGAKKYFDEQLASWTDPKLSKQKGEPKSKEETPREEEPTEAKGDTPKEDKPSKAKDKAKAAEESEETAMDEEEDKKEEDKDEEEEMETEHELEKKSKKAKVGLSKSHGEEKKEVVEEDEEETYIIGEEVLVFFGKRLFNATVLEIDTEEDADPYHVHFLDWNSRHDMWVPLSHMVKMTEDNKQYQNELEEAEKKEKKANVSKQKRAVRQREKAKRKENAKKRAASIKKEDKKDNEKEKGTGETPEPLESPPKKKAKKSSSGSPKKKSSEKKKSSKKSSKKSKKKA